MFYDDTDEEAVDGGVAATPVEEAPAEDAAGAEKDVEAVDGSV